MEAVRFGKTELVVEVELASTVEDKPVPAGWEEVTEPAGCEDVAESDVVDELAKKVKELDEVELSVDEVVLSDVVDELANRVKGLDEVGLSVDEVVLPDVVDELGKRVKESDEVELSVDEVVLSEDVEVVLSTTSTTTAGSATRTFVANLTNFTRCPFDIGAGAGVGATYSMASSGVDGPWPFSLEPLSFALL